MKDLAVPFQEAANHARSWSLIEFMVSQRAYEADSAGSPWGGHLTERWLDVDFLLFWNRDS